MFIWREPRFCPTWAHGLTALECEILANVVNRASCLIGEDAPTIQEQVVNRKVENCSGARPMLL